MPVLIKQVPAICKQGSLVAVNRVDKQLLDSASVSVSGEQAGQRNDKRRVGDDPRPAVGDPRELSERLHAVPGARLRCALGQRGPLPRRQPVPQPPLYLIGIRAGVEDLEVRLAAEHAHGDPVPGRRRPDHRQPIALDDAVLPGRYLQARGKALDVPFPRPGERLVEVIDVEYEPALGRTEQAEIAQVRIAA